MGQRCLKFFGQLPLAKKERREDWLQERKEKDRKDKERREEDGIFPWSLDLEIDNI